MEVLHTVLIFINKPGAISGTTSTKFIFLSYITSYHLELPTLRHFLRTIPYVHTHLTTDLNQTQTLSFFSIRGAVCKAGRGNEFVKSSVGVV